MRIAFVGTGNIARQHGQGLTNQENVEFVAGYDAIPGRARAFTEDFGGQPYESLPEMLDEAAPEAVWVCLPPFAHGEAEMALLERGIPFLVEKPVSNSMQTAREIAKKVEETGTLVAAGYMNRYRRGVNRARELLVDDPAVLVHGAWIGGTPGVPWWREKALSGGQIVEQTTHIFDLVRYLVGEPETVCAQAARGFVRDLPDYDVEDASAVTVRFAGGAVGSLMSCCANRSGGGGVHLTIVARDHVSNFAGWENELVIQKSRLEEERVAGEPNIFEIEDATFLRAVAEDAPGLVRSPYADAVKTLAFCLAANEALETHETIEVSSL